jgi:hypothetical protein
LLLTLSSSANAFRIPSDHHRITKKQATDDDKAPASAEDDTPSVSSTDDTRIKNGNGTDFANLHILPEKNPPRNYPMIVICSFLAISVFLCGMTMKRVCSKKSQYESIVTELVV